MHKTTRLHALLLALCLLLALLAGCGSANQPDPNGAAPSDAGTEADLSGMKLLAISSADESGAELYRTVFDYDAEGRLTQMRQLEPSGEETAVYGFVYDADGRLTEQTLLQSVNETEGSGSESYEYDADGRLLTVRSANAFYSLESTVTRGADGLPAQVTVTQESTGFMSPAGTVSESTVTFERHEQSDGGCLVLATVSSDPAAPYIQQAFDANGVALRPYAWMMAPTFELTEAMRAYRMDRNGLPGICQNWAEYMCAPQRWHSGADDAVVKETADGFTATLPLAMSPDPFNPTADTLVYGRPSADVETILAESKAAQTQDLTASLPDWSAAYRSFILDGGYRTSGQEYGYAEYGQTETHYDQVSFGLYDLDRNGVPELLALKGGSYMGNQSQYVYTYDNGEVRYLGTAGAYELGFAAAPGTDYPGLFTIWMMNGSGVCSYLTLENGAYRESPVFSYRLDTDAPDQESFLFTQETSDDALYQLTRDMYQAFFTGGTLELDGPALYPVDAIRSMGWEAFTADF